MDLSTAEHTVLERFAHRGLMAGGPKPGLSMRRRAIEYLATKGEENDCTGGLAGLVEKGVLKANESGERYYLTESGAALLSEG